MTILFLSAFLIFFAIGLTYGFIDFIKRRPFWNDKKPQADIKKAPPFTIDKNDPETQKQIKEYEQKRRNLWDDKQKWYETPSKKERLGP